MSKIPPLALLYRLGLYPYHTPQIQEEETVRENTARGPKGRGQYFSVLTPPLGLGGYGTDISWYPALQFSGMP